MDCSIIAMTMKFSIYGCMLANEWADLEGTEDRKNVLIDDGQRVDT